MAQGRRDLLGEELHALARQVVGHIAELELDQQIADFSLFDQILNAPGNRLRAADDDRLRGVQLIPVLDVAQKLSPGLVTF